MEEKAENTCVIVKLEIGHKANIRSKPTAEGFTHDWTIFVRGAEGSNIQHYVERVVFYLHESFPKPKRVVKEPPYQVCESGYAGFMINIEVHFRSKEEPKKVVFNYDLYLHLEGPPISYCRAEKVIFQNPTEDFRRKLLRAGGVGIHGSEGGTVLNTLQKPSPSSSNSNSHGSSQTKPTKHVSEAIKQPKSSTGSTSIAPPVNTTQTSVIKQETKTPVAQPPQTFLDLFGQPIKTSKASPDPQRVKDLHTKSSSKSSKPANSNSLTSDQTSNNSSSTKDILKPSFSKETKELKEAKKDKSATKRPPSPSLSATGDASQTKKRKTISSSGGSFKHKDGKYRKKSEKKVPSKDKEKKEKREKHKHAGEVAHTKHVPVERVPVERKSLEEKSCKETDVAVKVIKKTKQLQSSSSPSLSNSSASSETKSSRSNKVSPPSPDRTDGSPRLEGDASPSSSISLSPLHQGRGHGPLGALMAAYEDGVVLSPMSSDSSGSPPHAPPEEEPVPVAHVQPTIPVARVQPLVSSKPPPHLAPPERAEKPKTKEEKGKAREEKLKAKEERQKVKEEKVSIKDEKSFTNKEKKVKKSREKSEKTTASELSTTTSLKKGSRVSSKEQKPTESVPNLSSITEEYAMELKELQRQIMTLRDRKHLQQIVNVIEETGLYQVTSTTFDFDLCTLDRGTVIKLQNCLAAVVQIPRC